MYPTNDDSFEETKVKLVSKHENGWTIEREDGWSFWVPGDSRIVPESGMTARFYGKGIGYSVRGLFLDRTKVFYRTVDEDKEHQEIKSYGADATVWLDRWDNGKSVWTIEMGGLGPGYEQCIHITCAEIIRHLLKKKYDVSLWEDEEVWKLNQAEIEKMSHENPIITKLGLSGAQWGAALNLAIQFYRRGPREIMRDEAVKSRHILVSRSFP